VAEREEPSVAWYFEHGSDAAARGDTARAEQYLELALQRGGDERRVLPLLLAVCLRSSHLRAALSHAEPYLRSHPDDLGLRYLVANLELELGTPARAQRELERILESDPSFARAHYLLATLELESGTGGAKSHLQRYLELEPEGEHAAEAHERLRELAR
jgi:predicted Zn-dependent protease